MDGIKWVISLNQWRYYQLQEGENQDFSDEWNVWEIILHRNFQQP